jgi:tetratricopeptide (TPR) repeat protein
MAERLDAERKPRWRVVLAATGLAAALAVGVLSWRTSGADSSDAERVVPAAARLETREDTLAVRLNDGSSLALGSRTQVAVQHNQSALVALSLSRGELRCNVTHRPERSFTVVAADVEVRVVGTEFSVKSTPEAGGARVEVSVLRGVVEIKSGREPGIVARVAAGQSWMQLPRGRAQPTEPASSAAVVLDAAAPASELFERAGERRRAGDAAAAAKAYEELLRLHPGDGRASLSAFELGRLRMDRLGDSAGAIAALERAVALNVGPSFREDALARLVSVYATQGNFVACGRARDRYLASYPAGIHAGAVSSRCGKR